MSKPQWISFAVVVVVLLGLLAANMVSRSNEQRVDRIATGVSLCETAVLYELSGTYLPNFYGDQVEETAKVDGKLEVQISGTVTYGRSGFSGYACRIAYEGNWHQNGGWGIALTSVDGK